MSSFLEPSGVAATIRVSIPPRERALPVLITAPHGGAQSFELPERCTLDAKGRPLLHRNGRQLSKLADRGTLPLAGDLQRSITRAADGYEPYVVTALFHRKYIDANRAETDHAFETKGAKGPLPGSFSPLAVHRQYHTAVANALDEMGQSLPGVRKLLIDVHGQVRRLF
jgi:hypothetical protein